VVLFGSYAYSKPSENSDINLAVWDNLFTGCGSIDIVPIVSIVSKYPQLELHPFNAQEENDHCAEEIEKKENQSFKSYKKGHHYWRPFFKISQLF